LGVSSAIMPISKRACSLFQYHVHSSFHRATLAGVACFHLPYFFPPPCLLFSFCRRWVQQWVPEHSDRLGLSWSLRPSLRPCSTGETSYISFFVCVITLPVILCHFAYFLPCHVREGVASCIVTCPYLLEDEGRSQESGGGRSVW
jgi:hypothetical protein